MFKVNKKGFKLLNKKRMRHDGAPSIINNKHKHKAITHVYSVGVLGSNQRPWVLPML